MLEQYGDVLNPRDVAKILGVGKNRVYEMMQNGIIKAIRLGNIWRIPKTYMIEYLSTCGYTQSTPMNDSINNS